MGFHSLIYGTLSQGGTVTPPVTGSTRPSNAGHFYENSTATYTKTAWTTQGTLAAWVKFDSIAFGTNSMIYQGRKIITLDNSDNKIYFDTQSTTNTYSTGVWYFIAFSGLRSGGAPEDIDFYIYDENGLIESFTQASYVTRIFSETLLNIGGQNRFIGATRGGGYINSFGIWDRTFTSTEVGDLWNTGNGISYSDLSASQLTNLGGWFDYNSTLEPDDNTLINGSPQTTGTIAFEPI